MVGAVQAIGAAVVLLTSSGAAASAAQSTPSASAPSLSPSRGEVTVLGELHGTSEIPALFLGTVRRAARRGPLVVGLELPPEAAAVSCGTATPRHLTPWWTSGMRDGRTSIAMRRLVCGLQRLERSRSISLVYLDNVGREQDYDQLAAERFARAFARGRPAGLILTGSYHARNSDGTLASHLRARGLRVRTIVMSAPGGTAWVCLQDQPCGVQEIQYNFCSQAGADRQATPPRDAGAWDRCYSMPPLTASAPATP